MKSKLLRGPDNRGLMADTLQPPLDAFDLIPKESGLTPEAVDCILYGTFTPDYFLPSAACNIEEEIGAKMRPLSISAAHVRGSCLAKP